MLKASDTRLWYESDATGRMSPVFATGAASIPTQRSALRALTAGRQVVYAMRVPDGAIKIGTTRDLGNRLSGLHGELLAFTFGGRDEERALHGRLAEHVVRGREYFAPAPPVIAEVNAMREVFGLSLM